MKSLEKKVHFTTEGKSVGCYDSKGNPVGYILVAGEPFIRLEKHTDRLLKIDSAVCYSSQTITAYHNYNSEKFSHVALRGVVNSTFIAINGCSYAYANRACTKAELASYHLAMYKAYKNAIKLEAK